ncbi:histidine kinase, partial [bacterium]|nr:histidine kinase [bacterium]
MKKLESLKDVIDLPSFDHEENSFHPTTEFRKLMQKRVREILLVSSLYDSFLLAQDGRIDEQMISEFTDMNLYHVPGLIRSSNGKEALTMLEGDRRFNIILTTMNIGEMRVVEFAKKAKEKYPDTPIILLLFDDRELEALRRVEDTSVFDQIYIWQGNFKILLAIVKVVEDRINVEHDTWAMGVQSIILVEDNIRFYSSFLPMIYTEVMKQSQRLLDDGLNLAHKLLRMAARPKILHCTSYEEAIEFYNRYEKTVLGVITDVEYEMNGVKNSEAGTILAKVIRDRRPDLPIMIQSFQPRYEAVAHELNAHFLQKNSTTLLSDLREFMTDNFSFGDFLFRSPDGEVIDSANNLKSLEEKLKYIDERSLLFHAERDHFSGWLKARTEFSLAEKLKPSKVSDFSSPKKLREYIVKSLRSFRQDRVKGVVADFKPEYMDSGSGFVRIGGGSLGGKARGLAFINHLLDKYGARDRLPGIYIGVPPTVVLSTDVFDKFLETNDLVSFALNENDDVKILQRFLHSPFPVEHEDDIRKFLEIADYPLAVRSSSLLEDSQYHPFAGIYETFMIPNNEESLELRLESLLIAVKSVYASVFFSHAKNYIRSTMY